MEEGDGRLVGPVLRLARLLARVRGGCDPGAWEGHCHGILMAPRQARHYARVGAAWADEPGPVGDYMFPRLSGDIQKMGALCRIPVERLEDFLARTDPRSVDRAALAQAVNAFVGVKRGGPPAPGQQIDRACRRLTALFERLLLAAGDEERPSLHTAILAGVSEARRRADEAARVGPPCADDEDDEDEDTEAA